MRHLSIEISGLEKWGGRREEITEKETVKEGERQRNRLQGSMERRELPLV